MSLLDTRALQTLFGQVFAPLYGSGRLIRVAKIRGQGGVMLNEYLPPESIKVQVDRCDEEMRSQSGYTANNVKLLVLQAGISSPMPTTNDIIEAKGRRWNMFAIGEDPASTYWRGRGVEITGGSEFDWMFGYGHWDDDRKWLFDQTWTPVAPAPAPELIADWSPMAKAQAAILAMIDQNGDEF